jgi:hypothetical protein
METWGLFSLSLSCNEQLSLSLTLSISLLIFVTHNPIKLSIMRRPCRSTMSCVFSLALSLIHELKVLLFSIDFYISTFHYSTCLLFSPRHVVLKGLGWTVYVLVVAIWKVFGVWSQSFLGVET